MSGFLGVEPLIVARLAASVAMPSLKVLAAPDLDGIQAASQPVPAVHVVFGGFERLESAGGLTEVVETWLTVAVVRNSRAAAQGAAARADAGTLLDAVFSALNGWTPAGYRPLVPATPPAGGYDAGFGYFPLSWRVRRLAALSCAGAV